MMVVVFIMFGMAALSIVLGFIALIMQKTYIDSETRQPTEIVIPFLGKMRSNFPALVFVLLGFLLAFKATPPPEPPLVDWAVYGSFSIPEGSNFDPDCVSIAADPWNFVPEVGQKGTFVIRTKIPEGKDFEDVFETIHFDHPGLEGFTFIPKKELKKGAEESLIAESTKTTRELKPIPLNPRG